MAQTSPAVTPSKTTAAPKSGTAPKPAGANSPASSPDSPTSQTVEQLKKQVADLQENVNSLWQQIYNEISDIQNLKRSSATFDPASPDKYIRVETDAGSLLVSLGKVEPYLDGYKVELQVGNPLAATFKGFEIAATWAPRFKNYNGKYLEWLKNKSSKTFLSRKI